MKPNVSKVLKELEMAVSKHSPEILTGFGIAGMLTTTVLAVKATPKALRNIEYEIHLRNEYLLEEANANGNEVCSRVDKLNPLEVVKVAWKPYIPAAVTCTVSIACLVGASSVNARRNAALATAYNLSKTALAEYKEKVVETIGEKKEKQVKDKVAQAKVDKDPVDNKQIIITGNGTTLCYDAVSSRYFESDMETIKKAINTINSRLLREDYIALNDFYDELGLEHSSIGYDIGWNISKDGLIEPCFSSSIAKDGRACLVVDYQTEPRYDFNMWS